MGRFFQNLQLNRTSFFLGFFTGIVFWWLLGRARPWLVIGFHRLRDFLRAARESLTTRTDVRLRNDTLRTAQKMQLVSPLFSLDEIVITPRMLAPPRPIQPGILPPQEDIVATTIPYLPDWPEMATVYGAPTFTLAEAFQGNANLVIIGRAGSGKTVALAHLASQMARQDPLPGDLNNYFPVLIHAADIVIPARNPENLLETLKDAVSQYASVLTQTHLLEFFSEIFTNGQALLLLDGLDAMPPGEYSSTVEYLRQILKQYPRSHCITTATPEYFDGLTDLGFIPLSMAIWGGIQKAAFLEKWNDLWKKFINQQSGGEEPVNPVLLNSWLMSETAPMIPLDFTLKVWSTYAGDLLGPSAQNSLDAYLRRMSTGISKGRPAMEKLALQALISRKPYFTQKEAQSWVAEFEPLQEPGLASDPQLLGKPELSTFVQKDNEPIHLSRLVSSLLDSGLLQQYGNNRLGFSHPLILSYLAGCGLLSISYTNELLEEPNWGMTTEAIGFMAEQCNDSMLITRFLERSHEPLHRELMQMGRWLPHTPETAPWKSQVMRLIANLVQNTSEPIGLRARAISALAMTGGVGVGVLFRQLMASSDSSQRQIAALGCGLLRDNKSADDLNKLINDRVSDVCRAASLALVAIGNRQALEFVADALLTGEDEIRQTAAQALANHPEEGYPTLREAAALDDLLVRKAAISGLRRVNQTWALQLIDDLHVKEEQWVVKDAAAQAIKEMALPNPRIPNSLPPLADTPWLISFAGERGIGVVPGKAAWELLMKALKEGNEDQRLAALHYLSAHDYSAAILPIYQIFYNNEEEIKEAAYNTLWHMASAGVDLPLPLEFGLGLPG